MRRLLSLLPIYRRYAEMERQLAALKQDYYNERAARMAARDQQLARISAAYELGVAHGSAETLAAIARGEEIGLLEKVVG